MGLSPSIGICPKHTYSNIHNRILMELNLIRYLSKYYRVFYKTHPDRQELSKNLYKQEKCTILTGYIRDKINSDTFDTIVYQSPITSSFEDGFFQLKNYLHD